MARRARRAGEAGHAYYSCVVCVPSLARMAESTRLMLDMEEAVRDAVTSVIFPDQVQDMNRWAICAVKIIYCALFRITLC